MLTRRHHRIKSSYFAPLALANMLKVSRSDAGLRSPMTGSMSAQRRRYRKAAAASDSLASLMMPSNTNNSLSPSSSSSSARKKSSKNSHHHRSTPSSLEQIVDTVTTPVIAEETSTSTAAPAPPLTGSIKKSATKTKHSGKRSSSSMTTSLSSLEPQIGSSTNNNYASSSSQKKSHKKKRQMSPRSKSKLDSLVTQPSLQQQQQQQQDRVHDKSQRKPQQQKQHQTDAEPIVKGSLVLVKPRTWPGMNKLGGVGRVIAVHKSTSYDLDSQQQYNEEEGGRSNNNIIDASTSATYYYDVSYVLGGKDRNIEAEYVSLHDTSQEAPRERQQRTLSTLEESEKDTEEVPKKKSVKKKRKLVMSSGEAMEILPIKKKEESEKGHDNKINANARGKQLRQLKKVKDQHMAAAEEEKEEEEESTASNLKSPAFSLSSQFSKQDGTLSPLDYLADSYPKIDTPVLETYSEKWSSHREQQQNQQQQKQNAEEEEDEDRDDDPSSSVVSTDEDGSGFTPPKQRRRRSSPVKYPNRAMKGDMSPPSENKSLEREYGRLALKKQEIERKMKIYKSDAEKINPWATASAGGSNVASGSSLFAQSSGQSEEFSSRPHRDVTDGNSYSITRYGGGVPSRSDVEFGELVYQRNLTDRRMAELKDGYPKRSIPKKKRRRRVVETITRVIHEESEDDGSSISDRHLKDGRYGSGYYDPPDRSYRSQNPISNFDRRRSGSSYSESQSPDQYYARKHSSQNNQTQSVELRKRKDSSRKTKSHPSSMLEDLD